MILQWRDANGEWIKAGQKGTKREQCCPVLFSVCCVRPPTRDHSVHPPLIYPGILQWRVHNFRVLIRRSLMMVTAFYLCIPIPFRTVYTVYVSLFYVRAIFFSVTNNLLLRSSLWDIPNASENYATDAVTRRNSNGGIIDYTKNRYRRIRGDHEFMRRYGSAANGFTYPFITELVGVKFGYRVLTRQLT